MLYTDDRTGFGVVELAHLRDPERARARATGPLADLSPGQPVALHGQWTVHPTHGETFAASYFTPTMPRTVAGLEAFLAGDHFPGIGRRLAAALVAAFGLELPDRITTDPDALTDVRGITDRLRDVIVDGWRQAGLLGGVVTRLAEVGIGAAPARWLVGQFGDDALEVIDRDPYVLLGAPGLRWNDVERLARAQKIAADDPARQVAAASWVMRGQRARGDVAIVTDDLVDGVAQLLAWPPARAADAVRHAVDASALDAWAPPGDQVAIRYALPSDALAEQQIADVIVRLDTEYRPREVNDAQVRAHDDALTDEQLSAVRMAFNRAVSVLTGGPGTGKTRTVSTMLACAVAADDNVALCAPTGRAAKRLEELTGHRATTIHRLLEARPTTDTGDDGFTFAFDATRRLPHDLIVADEWSMADVGLAHALLRAVADGSRVVLVGDVDQLPPVGPGAVLRDLLTIAQLGSAPVGATTLTTVHRQAAQSRIITLAHELKDGTAVAPRGRDGDVFAVPQATAGVADRVAEIVAVRAPAYFDCTPSEVQVLAPRYGGPAGVDRINEVLRDRCNPRRGRAAVAGFCEGDRVVQTRNNLELGVVNGEVGEVTAVDAADQQLEAAFDAGTVVFSNRDARDLRPAWCLTVHKSQGGQWPVVVLVLDSTHGRMLWRELVYTAVTRAVRGLLIVGSPPLLVAAARRTGSGIARRHTSLEQRLRAATAIAAAR
ncbi:ATP-dependent RecD-like DNA helicase [soil metagenome]